MAVAESEVRDPNYLGSVATSGVADAQEAYQRFAQGSSNRMLLVLASTVKALYPEFQVSDMLKDTALPAYQRVAQTCGGETEPEFTSEMLKPGWESNRFVKDFFSRNTPGQKPAHGPLLVISGEADLCHTGGNVGKNRGSHVQARKPNPFFEVSGSRCQRRDGSVGRRPDQLDQGAICRLCCAWQLPLTQLTLTPERDKPGLYRGKFFGLPLAVGVGRVILPSDLIAFVMHNENHAHGCESGRNDKDQNAALQRSNHSSASGSRLGITERAALGKSGHSGQQQDQSCQRKPCEPKERDSRI